MMDSDKGYCGKELEVGSVYYYDRYSFMYYSMIDGPTGLIHGPGEPHETTGYPAASASKYTLQAAEARRRPLDR